MCSNYLITGVCDIFSCNFCTLFSVAGRDLAWCGNMIIGVPSFRWNFFALLFIARTMHSVSTLKILLFTKYLEAKYTVMYHDVELTFVIQMDFWTCAPNKER